MRSLIAITASVTMLMAQVPLVPAYADTTAPAPQVATQNAAIAAAFNAYPNGGEALSKQVLGLVMSNPKLAPDVVIYMRNTPGVNRAQKLAAEHGLAAALDQLKIKAADLGSPMVTKDYVPTVANALGGPLVHSRGNCSLSARPSALPSAKPPTVMVRLLLTLPLPPPTKRKGSKCSLSQLAGRGWGWGL